MVKAPPAAALNRWQIQLATHRGWEAAGIKMLGKPEIYEIFRELERALVNRCGPALLEDGSAIRDVDLAGEPHCTQASQRTLQFSRNQVIVSFKYNSIKLEVNLTPGALRAVGWDVEAMAASNDRNDRKIWVKPCIYGVTHLRDFRWLVSTDATDWREVRQRTPNLVRGRVTQAGGATTWRKLQEARKLDEQAGRPWADDQVAT